VFIDPDYLQNMGILAIRKYLKQKLAYLWLHGLSGHFGPKWQFWGQNRGRGGAMLTVDPQ